MIRAGFGIGYLRARAEIQRRKDDPETLAS
jgi:hypothetical protein